MNKISEFYIKAVADNAVKAKLEEILSGADISEADDKQLEKIGELAKQFGYEFTLDEVKAFLKPAQEEIADEALEMIAGGKGVTLYEKNFGDCDRGGVGSIKVSVQ